MSGVIWLTHEDESNGVLWRTAPQVRSFFSGLFSTPYRIRTTYLDAVRAHAIWPRAARNLTSCSTQPELVQHAIWPRAARNLTSCSTQFGRLVNFDVLCFLEFWVFSESWTFWIPKKACWISLQRPTYNRLLACNFMVRGNSPTTLVLPTNSQQRNSLFDAIYFVAAIWQMSAVNTLWIGGNHLWLQQIVTKAQEWSILRQNFVHFVFLPRTYSNR